MVFDMFYREDKNRYLYMLDLEVVYLCVCDVYMVKEEKENVGKKKNLEEFLVNNGFIVLGIVWKFFLLCCLCK